MERIENIAYETLREVELREDIVAEAKTWVGTPYHAMQAVKGKGCDCALFPHAVYSKFIPKMAETPIPYVSPQHNQHSDSETYLNWILSCGAREISEAEVRPGDFVLYKVLRTFFHGGIVISWPGQIVHSVQRLGVVYSHGTDEGFLIKRPRRFFTW